VSSCQGEAIHLDSDEVTSDEQSDAMERGTEYVLPVSGEVPASSLIGSLGAGDMVDGVESVTLELEVFEHATSAALLTASSRRTRCGDVAVSETPTIVCSSSRARDRVPEEQCLVRLDPSRVARTGHNVRSRVSRWEVPESGANRMSREGLHKISVDLTSARRKDLSGHTAP
jgi:hypothetical protein